MTEEQKKRARAMCEEGGWAEVRSALRSTLDALDAAEQRVDRACALASHEHTRREQVESERDRLQEKLADAQRLADISEQSRVDAWQQVDRLRAQAEELQVLVSGIPQLDGQIADQRATIAEQARRIEAAEEIAQRFAKTLAECENANARELARIAQLEQALREVAFIGTDCAPAMHPESFYRSQLHRAIGIAARALETALKEQAAPGEPTLEDALGWFRRTVAPGEGQECHACVPAAPGEEVGQ